MRTRYGPWDESRHGDQRPAFDKLFDLFQQLLLHTGGDADEALRWLTALDEKYGERGILQQASAGKYFK